MRTISSIALALLVASNALGAQSADSLVSHGDKTFLVKRDLVTGGIALGATALLSIWDNDIAIESQKDTSHHTFADRASKVQETTLTVGGLVVYGVARLAHAETVADIALHATESVVLASVASQLIRGPLGRARPYVTHDSDQYSFHAFQGFGNFKYRSFPQLEERLKEIG